MVRSYILPLMLAVTTAAFGQNRTTLSAEAIRSDIVGNTISGIEDGERYVEFLRPDGTISGHSPSGSYTGKWRISGKQICFLYNGEKGEAKGGWDCSEARLVGDKVFWSGAAASEASTLAHGDPNGL
jgi:hypothetical protein